MPRIPTESEIKRLRQSREKDERLSAGPRCPVSPENVSTSLDLEIDISRDVKSFCSVVDKCTTMIHEYHMKFLELAMSSGLHSEPVIHSHKEDLPQIDALRFSITMDPTESELILEKRLDMFKKIAMEQVRRHRDALRARGQLAGYIKNRPHYGEWATNYFREVITDKRGTLKTINDLKKELDLAIEAYTTYSKSYFLLAIEMGFVKDTSNDKESKRGEQSARRYYKRAEKLTKAAVEGKFLEELKKPLRD